MSKIDRPTARVVWLCAAAQVAGYTKAEAKAIAAASVIGELAQVKRTPDAAMFAGHPVLEREPGVFIVCGNRVTAQHFHNLADRVGDAWQHVEAAAFGLLSQFDPVKIDETDLADATFRRVWGRRASWDCAAFVKAIRTASA